VLTSLLTVSIGDEGTGSHVPGGGAAPAAGCSIDDGDLGNGSGQYMDGELEPWDDEGIPSPATGGGLQMNVQLDDSNILPRVSGPPASGEDLQHVLDTSEEGLDTLVRGERVVSPEVLRRKNTKAAIRMATLNMKGFSANDPLNPGSKINKWNHVNQLMRENNIAILVLQETHLTEERKCELERLFPKLYIVASYDCDNPSGRAGIAVVLNRDKTLTEAVEMTEIKQGRAMLVRTRWHTNDNILNILAIYAPNEGIESERFFMDIKDYLEANNQLGSPDIMLGDFNVVEQAIDRLPMHLDREGTIEALTKLKDKYRLADGWRTTYQTLKDYTFVQESTKSRSRIDRIYVTKTLLNDAREWQINVVGIPTDHMLASVLLAHPENPDIGPGRWAMRMSSIRDQEATKFAREEGIKVAEELAEIERTGRTGTCNPQTIWLKYKKALAAKMRMLDRKRRCILDGKIKMTRRSLQEMQNNDRLTEEERLDSAKELTETLEEMTRLRHTLNRENLATKNWTDGESMTKAFARRGKASKPRDNIRALKIEGGANTQPQYEKCSRKMAEMARKYHDELQNDTVDQRRVTEEERMTVIGEAASMLDPKLSAEDRVFMEELLSEDQVLEALKHSDNDKAAGLDGTIYELYKILNERYHEDKRCNRPAFNIIAVLTSVFNDIELQGVASGTQFSEGWMCPTYKKNERSEIANYRPITILNADYKLFTKALTRKVTKVASKLINLDQAGFMPNRKITDHTELVKLIADYAEAYEINGVIVALDQEKAYDKVAHDYLYQCLRQFGFPDHFINIVKSIYSKAETRVMINGHLSAPFQVRRGVRQGDPMSCLLFNFAIEPLATSLRKSALKGIEIPNCVDNLLVKLFADDTTAFLSEDDDFYTLKEVLDKWCIASKAKFNIAKTEILPIGKPDFREQVIEHRVTRVGQLPIPENIPIVQEGDCMRILGSWVGNEMDIEKPWKNVLKKIESSLENWERCHPTMEERRHIVNAVQGAMTQYLMTVQDIPETTLEELDRNIRRFVWGDKTQSPVRADYLFAPIEKGGRKVLDIRARAEAVVLMRLKSYLNLGEGRPLWAKVADALFAKHITKKEAKLSEPRVRQNIFLQSWSTSEGSQSKLPKRLKLLVKVAKKYGVRLDSIAMSKEAVREMPIWFHLEADKAIRYKNKQKASRCLRDSHGVFTVGDTEKVASTPIDHKNDQGCQCQGCHVMRQNDGCKNPIACIRMARSLLDTLPKRWDPRSDQTIEEKIAIEEQSENDDTEGVWTTFDPRTVVNTSLKDAFRILADAPKVSGDVTKMLRNEQAPTSVLLATDGACDENGKANAKAGAGVYYGLDDPRNISCRVPEEITQTNQTGEILAAERAVALAEKDINLKLELDSKYVINAVTKNLQSNEDNGYTGVENKMLLKALVSRLRERETRTYLKWVKGHSGHERNERADEAARKAITDDIRIPVDLEVTGNASVSGIKLSKATQSLIYKAIRQKKIETLQERRRTRDMIETVIDDLERCYNYTPTEASIWKAIRHKDFSKKFRYFAWMTLHDAYMTGTNWDRPDYPQEIKDRALCELCGNIDNLDHIFFRCEAPGQEEVWSMVKELWSLRNKDSPCPEINLGTVLGCALLKLDGQSKAAKTGNERLWRIIASESVYLIWKVWCKRKIGGEHMSTIAIKNLWLHTINSRLRMDCRLTAPYYGKKGISKSALERTWIGVLRDNDSPLDWKSRGVLVGIAIDRTSGRYRGGIG
jgi:ribonuclease HI/exonuclease III